MTDAAAPTTESTKLTPVHDITTQDGVLAELDRIRIDLDERERLFELRRDVFRAGRALTPPVTHAAMGRAAGVTEVLVINQIKPKAAKGDKVNRDRRPR